jgi:hypothetical protein
MRSPASCRCREGAPDIHNVISLNKLSAGGLRTHHGRVDDRALGAAEGAASRNPGGRKVNQHEHRGSCHCGNLRWTLRSDLSLAQLPVRTCGCRFCRKHGLLTTSDPQGEMDFILTDDTAVLRYRFDTNTADFLMCGRCGVYVGAQMEEAGRYYAIANLRTLDGEGELGMVQPMDYSREGVSERLTRRASRWTPVRTPA